MKRQLDSKTAELKGELTCRFRGGKSLSCTVDSTCVRGFDLW